MQTQPIQDSSVHAAEAPVLVPGSGCLGAPGLWVLSLTGRPVRCVDPQAPAAGARAPSPLAAAAAVDAALERMGGAPREVVVGADLDPLLAGSDWSEAALAAAARLAEHHVRLRVCTRGAPGEGSAGAGWDRLLRSAASKAGATLEVALFTLDPQLAALYEPGAPAPSLRLGAAARLRGAGVRLEARLAPLVPWISDGAAPLQSLLGALARAGVERASASYLHVDAEHPARLDRLPPAQRALLRGCLGPAPSRSGEARLIPKALRVQGHQRLARLAAGLGLEVGVCRESNPDLPGACACLTAAPPQPSAGLRRDRPDADDAPRGRGRPPAPAPHVHRPGEESRQLALFL